MIAIVIGLYLMPTVLANTALITQNSTYQSEFPGVTGHAMIAIVYVVVVLIAAISFIVWRGRED